MRKDEPTIINIPFTAIALDVSRKPIEIPQDKWLVLGQTYTIIGVGRSLDGKLGFKLKEIILGKESEPFNCFNTIRFGIPKNQKNKTLEEELADLGIKVQKHKLENI